MIVLGGAKAADKMPVVGALLAIADRVLVSGARATTFLAAQGHPVGASFLAGDQDSAREYLAKSAAAGVEIGQFAEGTLVVARAIAESTAFTVVGGGDTTADLRYLGFTDSDFGRVSTGGGASLEFLAGAELPGLAALEAGDVETANSAVAPVTVQAG